MPLEPDEHPAPDPDAAYAEAQRRIAEARAEGADRLDLSGLGLTTLPAEIGQLTALTELELEDNNLTALPPEIGKLRTLAWLNLVDNNLTELPPEIGGLTALTVLNLRRNNLTALPPEISGLTALTELDLTGNNLTALPPEIGQLTALTELNLRRNNLTALPPEIGQLTALTKLNLWRNNLTALPPEIGELTALTKLDFRNNNLTGLPPQLARLPRTAVLWLDGNSLPDVPPLHVVEQGPAACVRYVRLAERPRQGWVWAERGVARVLGRCSRLAVAETVGVAALAGALAGLGYPQLIWSGAGIAPLLLMRYQASEDTALERFGGLINRLGFKQKIFGGRWRLLGKTLALGVGSVAIKLWTATEYLVCHPVNALSAIRGNLGELVRATDVTTPPELVPGAARRHDDDPASSVLFADLGTDIEINERFRRVIGKTPRRKTVPQVASWAVLGVFFTIAWLYRLNIKGAVVAYFPLLLMPDRPDVRAAPPATGARTSLAVQTGLALVCAATLATLYHAPAVREAATALADAAWYTGLVEWAIPHATSLPRAALWLLGGQAAVYLAARGCHAMARRSEEWSGQAGATPAWRGLAEGGYVLHKFAVVAWTALAFATFAPQLGLGLWRLVM